MYIIYIYIGERGREEGEGGGMGGTSFKVLLCHAHYCIKERSDLRELLKYNIIIS